MMFYSCVLVSFFIFGWNSAYGQVSEGVFCETPDGEYGTCIQIKKCTPLVNLLLSKSNDADVIKFLRASTCGYQGNTPLVCCKQAKSRIAPTSTTEENTNTLSNPPDPANNLAELPKSPNCGRTNVTNPRIVNGIPAKLGEFPWIVALGYRNKKNPDVPKWLCGGSLITKKHILTAGHCVHNRNDLYLARLGDLDLFSDDDGANPQTIPLIKAKIHEDYSPVTFTNDIAILTLKEEPTISSVWPICLPLDEPLRSRNLVKSFPVVAGWGSLYFNGPSSSSLQLTALPVVENVQCERAFQNKSIIDDRVLCAGFARGGKDACQGDSGGPLMYGGRDGQSTTFYQIGVVSYGFRCAEAGYPGVYTRVTAFVDWIQRNLD